MPNNASIIASLSPEVTRITVVTKDGRQQVKRPEDVLDTDQIILSSNGTPAVMRGNPGRKKKSDLQPLSDNVAEVLVAKDQHLVSDRLCQAVATNPGGDKVLEEIIKNLAEEVASLGFERSELERFGQPTSQVSVRRVNALKGMSDLVLKLRDATSGSTIDLDSTAFSRLFAFIMQTYKQVFDESGMRAEQIETIFAALSRKISDEWKESARKKMMEG